MEGAVTATTETPETSVSGQRRGKRPRGEAWALYAAEARVVSRDAEVDGEWTLVCDGGAGGDETATDSESRTSGGGDVVIHGKTYSPKAVVAPGVEEGEVSSAACLSCGKAFATAAFLERHVAEKHGRGVFCEKCGASFKGRAQLAHHAAEVHGGKSKVCAVCGAAFAERWIRDRHVRTVHMKSRPFACETCQMQFGDRGNLEKHVGAVHKKLRPFQCEQCLEKFGLRQTLDRHRAKIHAADASKRRRARGVAASAAGKHGGA